MKGANMVSKQEAAVLASPNNLARPTGQNVMKPSCWDLLMIFLKGGLVFGGGLGIMAALEEELVRKRQLVSREDFLATYSLGRLMPSGTMTAVAIAYGYRFRGWIGSVVALSALVLPSTLLTILLTIGYETVKNSPHLRLLCATILPAALGFIVVAAYKFAKPIFRPGSELLIAAGALVAAFPFDVHPAVILLAGGLIGLLVGDRHDGEKTQGGSRRVGS